MVLIQPDETVVGRETRLILLDHARGALDQTLVRLDPCLVHLDQAMVRLDATLGALDRSLVQLDQAMVELDAGLGTLDGRVVELNAGAYRWGWSGAVYWRADQDHSYREVPGMPVQHAIWKVGESPAALPTAVLVSEQQLEDMIVASPDMLSAEWMLIGRQEHTTAGGRIDLLAIAPDGSLVLIELKRHRTPREVVAQALDYASWVEGLTADRLAKMYQKFSGGGDLGEAFNQRFGSELDEDELNSSHQIIIVAAALDDSTERIITYLNARDVAINVVFFQVFQHGTEQLISRAWMIDPGETQENVAVTTKRKGTKEPWNGEYYVSFGTNKSRSWRDARKYGYICAGGGQWYSQTLKLLSPGDRVWVNIPGKGYVGVGIVRESVRPAGEFTVQTAEGERPCLEVLEHAEIYAKHADNSEKAEHFVGVDWVDTTKEADAFNEVGLFGIQHSVCRPRNQKWRHTIDRLKTKFTKWDSKG